MHNLGVYFERFEREAGMPPTEVRARWHAAVSLEPPEHHYITVTPVIMDLTDKTLLLTDGVPCENEFQRVSL